MSKTTIDALVEETLEAMRNNWHRHGHEELQDATEILLYLKSLAKGEAPVEVSNSDESTSFDAVKGLISVLNFQELSEEIVYLTSGIYTVEEIDSLLVNFRAALRMAGAVDNGHLIENLPVNEAIEIFYGYFELLEASTEFDEAMYEAFERAIEAPEIEKPDSVKRHRRNGCLVNITLRAITKVSFKVKAG